MPDEGQSTPPSAKPRRFDAAVVGAGLGGLASATRLAQSGRSVILIEQHNIPGGYATTFVRDGFEFDVSLHVLSGVGTPEKPGLTRLLLEKLGVAGSIDFIELPYLIRVLSGDIDVLVPASWDGFEQVLVDVSPRHTDQIHSLLTTMRERFVESYVEQRPVEESAIQAKYGDMTLAQVIGQFQLDQKCYQVLLAISDYFGSSPLLQSFDTFAVGMGDYLEHGAYYIRGKSQALANALLEAFRAHGGQVAFNNAVRRIEVADGRVAAVATAKGDVFEVDAVFSNADPLTTCALVGDGHVSEEYVRELEARPLSTSVVGVYMAVNKAAAELGLVTSETIITNADDEEALRLMNEFAPSRIEISCHEHSYPGDSSAVASTVSLLAASYADQWLRLAPGQYFDAKRSYAGKILDIVERHFPGLREYCMKIEVSTPVTHMRFASTRGGAIYGFERVPGQSEVGHESPIPGLFYVGAWSTAGGYEPALLSGCTAAEAYLGLSKKGASRTAPPHEAAPSASLTNLPSAGPSFVEAINPNRMRLEVSDIITETSETKTLRCKRTDGPIPPFQAGQYVTLELDVDGVSVRRPYTPSSAPGQGWLDLTIVDKPDGFCAPYLLNNVSIGDTLESSGFGGSFFYEPLIDGTELVFIAGGSGITPFMSIVRDLLARDHDVSVTLLYGSRRPELEVFGEELRQIATQVDWLTVHSVISEPDAGYDGLTGVIDSRLLDAQIEDLGSKTFFVCGPGAMYSAVLGSLGRLGVPRHRVRLELHGPPADITAEPGWPVDVTADQRVWVSIGDAMFAVRSGEPLLNSLERHGFALPARCRSGECSYCRVKVLSGETYSTQTACPREADSACGYVHSCCAYPLSDLHIQLDSP